MRIKQRYQALSRLRLELRRHLAALEHALLAVYERTPLVKGNVYELARQCGKPSCACRRGRLHRSTVLSWSHQGKTRLRSVPSEQRAELSRRSLAYRRVRQARAQVTTICRRLLKVIDRIEKLRREDP